MNNYHIMEPIGRGKHTTVYKGRKKKSIEYYAIKMVDKSHKNKILQEGKILQPLDHPNVLKLNAWYESSSHLWLVLEYCVGGDLMTLLRQDGQLPEDSVHDIAIGIVRALQFLHSNGIIYCDLKPSNLLLDENGHIKLCDFGLARTLNDISNPPTSMLSHARRGSPCYMAPELFQDGGVHSYASDFWSLGCVLYECYTGRPPFVGREFTQLVKSILSEPTPSLPGSSSHSFVNLIDSLLTKDPAERIQWPELCGHAFWRARLTAVTLPPEPAFVNMIEKSSKPCLLERNSDKPIQNKTPPRSREKYSKGFHKQDENSFSGLRGHETLVNKGTQSGRKTQTKDTGRTNEKQKDPSNPLRGVNLLRLSRIAKTNLQRENEKENYRRPMPGSTDIDSEVKIENTDMELDFNENPEEEEEEEAQDEPEGPDCSSSAPDEMLSQPEPHGNSEISDNKINQSDTSYVTNAPVVSDVQTFNLDSSQCTEVAATPPSVTPQLRNQRMKDDEGLTFDSDSSKSPSDHSHMLWHPSDLSVRPVMPGRKASKLSETIPALPFEALPVSDFIKLPKERMNALGNKIVGILNSNNTAEKQNVIRYLEMLSNNADSANVMINGPIMLVLVKVLRQPKISVLRVQLVSLIGLLIRHSTVIEDDLANSGILAALTDGLRDKQDKVRRFSMAALGELLFYISTQSEQARDTNLLQSPVKDNRPPSSWQIPNPLFLMISSILRIGEDDVAQLYALRTIENICSQGAYWAARFSSQDVIKNLCYIFKATGKQDSMRLTAGSCLVRILRFNPSSIQSVLEKLSFKDSISVLVKGTPREQQISLNILSIALLGSHTCNTVGRHLLPLTEDKNLVPSLVSLIEQGSEILRGKALVFVALLCKNGRRWLSHFFCNAMLLSAVDRLAKEKDSYLQQCLEGSVHTVASAVPGLLETITADIQQIMSGRRPGQISSLSSRVTSKNNIHMFPVVLHLVGSTSFKYKVVSHQVLQQLASLVKLAETPFQGRDDFQITLLRVLESMTEDPSVILQSPSIFICEVLPSLTILYKGNKDGDARFLCLKILFDVMVTFTDEPLEDKKRLDDLCSISNNHFLPLYPTLIEDEDPIPMYAQKLLVMLIEFKLIKISSILHLKIVSQCFGFLLGDLSSANVNSVKLCLALVSAPEMEAKLLSQLKVVTKIGNLLEFVSAKDMDDFLEPTLGLCRAFVLRSVSNIKGFVYSVEPTLLHESSSDASIAVDQQQCIRDIIDFGSNVGVLLELSAFREANVAYIASECVVLLLKAAPREASSGFLTNLSKVTRILESWSQAQYHLVVQRVLHALGYSCRQYLSHAMTLSISASEVLKIEAIISEMKCSNLQRLANAASLAVSELQRLPRCI